MTHNTEEDYDDEIVNPDEEEYAITTADVASAVVEAVPPKNGQTWFLRFHSDVLNPDGTQKMLVASPQALHELFLLAFS